MVRAGVIVLVLLAGLARSAAVAASEWTPDELVTLRSLWIGSLPALPPDPSNRYGDDPRAAEFGHRLFFDTRLSANGKVACASCHRPELAFTDGRRTAVGIATTMRNTPGIIGAAYYSWFFWDGRKDSQWSQALGPLEDAREHGMTRQRIVALMRADAGYRRRYTGLFGALPARSDGLGISRAFANLGKAIAAYERRLLPGPSRFDRYVAATLRNRTPVGRDRLSPDETAGLRLFISDKGGRCVRCHNGPLFTDNHFHDIGVPVPATGGDGLGRVAGIEAAWADEFNCLREHSDAPESACDELRFSRRGTAELTGAFKTPSLRNVSRTAPYMHMGQYETLDRVMEHYRTRPAAVVGRTELETSALSRAQFDRIEAFLRTLDSPVRAAETLLRAPQRE